jgi:hypothetical protein
MDKRASSKRQSPSEDARVALEREPAADRDAAIDAAIVAGYERVPPDELDPWAEAAAKRSVAAEPR